MSRIEDALAKRRQAEGVADYRRLNDGRIRCYRCGQSVWHDESLPDATLIAIRDLDALCEARGCAGDPIGRAHRARVREVGVAQATRESVGG